MELILTLLLLLPLAGALCQLLCGRLLPRRWLTGIACLAIGLSSLMALLALLLSRGETVTVALYQWIAGADFKATVTLLYDPTAAVMALMVTCVALLIHLYSVAFMAEERDCCRYFCYLNLFVFNMLVIVLAGDLLFLFLGWEGVGFCSYALIGFWYQEPANTQAGSKAFIITRIGDIALLLAMALLFASGTGFSLSSVRAGAQLLPAGLVTLIGVLLVIAAAGKSAQLPLSVWLPDAMAGPTPVSAPIHAATMVTAGVYLLIRLFPLLALSPPALALATTIGTLTALYGAVAALAQNDIKRLLAYSTISQVGYMVIGIGAGSIDASLFHLLCHAFYKALLFLGAGCVIMACGGEHDIRQLGPGLRQRYPQLFWPFLVATLSLAGLPPAAGFFSKGAILEALHGAATPLAWLCWPLACATAFLTALYSFRLLYLLFFPRMEANGTLPPRQPLPALMTLVLLPLALLALAGGLINLPLGAASGWLSRFIATAGPVAMAANGGSLPSMGLSLLDGLLAVAGLLAAHLLHGRSGPVAASIYAPFGRRVASFIQEGLGLDRLYQRLVAAPYQAIALLLWQRLDCLLVDGLLMLPGRLMAAAGEGCRRWSTGRLTTTLHAFLIGVTLLLVVLTSKISGWW